MDPVRPFRVLLGAVIFLLAAFLFEPSLFGGRLPAELMAAQMLRNVAGVIGAICGLLVVFDALFPKPKPPPVRSYQAFEPEPAPAPPPAAAPAVVAFPTPPPPEPTPEPDEEAAEPVWGGYVEPDEHTLKAARSLVEADLAEGAPKTSEGGLPPPPPRSDTD